MVPRLTAPIDGGERAALPHAGICCATSHRKSLEMTPPRKTMLVVCDCTNPEPCTGSCSSCPITRSGPSRHQSRIRYL